jgi:hypothetical protein
MRTNNDVNEKSLEMSLVLVRGIMERTYCGPIQSPDNSMNSSLTTSDVLETGRGRLERCHAVRCPKSSPSFKC